MAGEVNADLKWGDVPSYVKRTFKGSSARHIRLPSGFRLFVLSRYATVKEKDKRYSSFYSPVKPFRGDPGLDARLSGAERSSYERVEYMRECSAYAEQTAGSRYAIELRLTEPAWGYFGKIRRQGSKVKMGNGMEGFHFYIPGLEFPKMIKRVRAHDLIVKG